MVSSSEVCFASITLVLGRFVSWVMVKFHKDPVGDLGDQVVDFRDNAYRVVAQRWPIGSIAVALNLALT